MRHRQSGENQHTFIAAPSVFEIMGRETHTHETADRDLTDYGFVNRHARHRLAVGFLFRGVHPVRL